VLDLCFRNGQVWRHYVNLQTVLPCMGLQRLPQCFGWHKWSDGTFTGVLRDHVLSLRNVEDPPGHQVVEFMCHHAPSGAKPSATESALHDFLNTRVCRGF
jgi:8-oxoguanine DNA glycosylase, N-terminal domain